MQTDPAKMDSYQLDPQIVLDSDRKMAISSAQSTPSVNQTKSNVKTTSESTLIPSSSAYNLSQASHPLACFATIFFKCLSLFIYLFVSIFVPNVITYILVLVSAALDFWVVKNVSGRLLVGLRWWSQYDEKGTEVWRFQSFDKQYKSDPIDGAFFWTGQIISTVIWGFFLLIKILSLSLFWGTLTGINFGLCGINLYGYYKCRGDYKNKLKSLQIVGFKNIAGRLFS